MAFAEGVGPFPSLFQAGGYSTPGADLTGFAHVADVLNHLALPWFVLTIAFMGEALIMRNSLIDVIDDYFVTPARTKGVREKEILWRQLEPATRRAELLHVVMLPDFLDTGVLLLLAVDERG
jgi:ABC-type dipeptide/oligopeptide/nickel transport system permease component